MRSGALLTTSLYQVGINAFVYPLVAILTLNSTAARAQVADADTIARGAYLAKVADCAGCHTAGPGHPPFAGGLPLNSPEDCDAFASAFELTNFPYIESLSNAVRVNYTERIFSANEAPADVTIYFHHEMAQTPIYPAKLFFFCQTPAEEGGETPLCRSDVLFERLAEKCPEFARNCEQKGLRYSNVMPAENDPKSGMGRSWKSTRACAGCL